MLTHVLIHHSITAIKLVDHITILNLNAARIGSDQCTSLIVTKYSRLNEIEVKFVLARPTAARPAGSKTAQWQNVYGETAAYVIACLWRNFLIIFWACRT
jgi:hypothetical protein